MPRGGLPSGHDEMTTNRLVSIAGAASITLVRLRYNTGHSSVVLPLTLVLLLLCVAWAIPRSPTHTFGNWRAISAFLLAGVTAWALYRGAKAGAIGSTSSALGQGL